MTDFKPIKGAPLTYDRKTHLNKLVKGVRTTLSIAQAAALAGVPVSTVKDWIRRGNDQWENQESTDLAHLSATIKKAQAEKVEELIAEGLLGKRNGKFVQWLLATCFREDFGADAQIYKDLLDNFIKMSEAMKRYNDHPLQGYVNNGQVDRKETQETS